jgi:hypothetical protein
MEITGGSLQVTLAKNTLYNISMIDQNTLKVTTSTGTSNGSGVLTINLPIDYTKYDGWFALEISQGSNVVYMDTVTATRPYVEPSKVVSYVLPKVITTDEAVYYERIARYIINSIIGFSFEFTRKELHLVGNGTDFLPTDERITKIYSVKENNETIWTDGEDEPFKPFVGLYNVVKDYGTEAANRLEYKVVWNNRYGYPEFVENYDYVLDADVGWQVVPQDIQEATLMLVNDIVCGNNRYTNKYIDSFGSGAGRIDYFRESIRGTGNLIVDNILSKYILESLRAKVL